ncbi:MAG TPA: hypothetical protein VGU20_10150 [Stellaceae bacterium]|nr:hypothetical protein [Stellaceae bacterium]
MDGSMPMFRLGKRGDAELCCDACGVALGPVVLVEAAEANGHRVYRVRPAEEIARTLALAYEPFTPADLACRLSGLGVAARALEAGDMAKAAVATALLKLPPLSTDAVAKLARDPTRKKYNPYHRPAHSPDGTGGQFTDADGAAGGAVTPVATANRETPNAADAKAHPWKTRRNQKFRNFIAGEEQSTEHRPETDGYDEERQSGKALGRYQLQKGTALQDIGWVDDKGRWTAEAAKHGVTSDRDFLDNREAQETALDTVLAREEVQARNTFVTVTASDGTTQRTSLWNLAQQGQTYTDDEGRTIKITRAGIIAAAHRGGVPGTADFVERVASNGWRTKGLSSKKNDPAIARRLRRAQDVPYTPSRR